MESRCVRSWLAEFARHAASQGNGCTMIVVTASIMLAQEVVTLSEEGCIETSTYADLHRRSQLCALALEQLGVGCVLPAA